MNWNPEKAKSTLLECWDDYYEDNNDETVSKSDLRLMFLSSVVINLTTYDDKIDLIIGKEIYEVMKIVFEKKSFEYISNHGNYVKYIKTINYFKDWLEWGTSIRGAWFDYYGNSGDGFKGKYIQLMDYGFGEVELSEEFMKWFLYEFLKEKE